MTFEDLDKELPNGFHDAKLRKIEVDFANKRIILSVDLLQGCPGDPDPERRGFGTLRVLSPRLFFLEAPDPRYSFQMDGSPVGVDGDSVRAGEDAAVDALLRLLPPGTAAYRFFLEDWNSFLYLAGDEVQFNWETGG